MSAPRKSRVPAGNAIPVSTNAPRPVGLPRTIAQRPFAPIRKSIRPSPFASNGMPMPVGQGMPVFTAGPNAPSARLSR